MPVHNETIVISVVQLWEVRWTSRYGEYMSNVRTEVEAFTSEQQAQSFATSLRNAFALIRHTWGDKVEVIKGASK